MSPSGLPFKSPMQVLPACVTNSTNLVSCAEYHAARDQPEIGVIILVFAIGIFFFIVASFRIGKTPDEVWIAYQDAVQEWRDDYRLMLIEAIVGDLTDETNTNGGQMPVDTASETTPATSDEGHDFDRTRPPFSQRYPLSESPAKYFSLQNHILDSCTYPSYRYPEQDSNIYSHNMTRKPEARIDSSASAASAIHVPGTHLPLQWEDLART